MDNAAEKNSRRDQIITVYTKTGDDCGNHVMLYKISGPDIKCVWDPEERTLNIYNYQDKQIIINLSNDMFFTQADIGILEQDLDNINIHNGLLISPMLTLKGGM
jgi:dTDP-4-dehydrorhamnose 3,5-epimerase-like enzyme